MKSIIKTSMKATLVETREQATDLNCCEIINNLILSKENAFLNARGTCLGTEYITANKMANVADGRRVRFTDMENCRIESLFNLDQDPKGLPGDVLFHLLYCTQLCPPAQEDERNSWPRWLAYWKKNMIC